jgi:predicted Zn-dependent protease with MMP-like domain
MLQVNDEQFQELINSSMAELPKQYTENLKNVAILYEDDPTPAQRQQLKLNCHETLYGLYEGVPLAARQGEIRIYPDKITIFKNPMLASSNNLSELKKLIKHTLWHEIAHYYGLDHSRIHQLEAKQNPK